MDNYTPQFRRFIPGSIYVAKGMYDVCMYVVKQQYSDSQRIKLKVKWYNQRSGMFIVDDKVEVQTKDLYRWSLFAL